MHELPPRHPPFLITAGTNGRINMLSIASDEASAPVNQTFQQVHQNSIQSLESVELLRGLWLFVTGGDDNAIGFTLVSGSPSGFECRTLLVPKAHAAAVTALRVISSWDSHNYGGVTVVSAGNDQRVKVWKIDFSYDVMAGGATPIDDVLESMKLRKVYEEWICVADVSNIDDVCSEVDDDGRATVDVMILGVGMEILQIEIEA
jgi:WD40 repeat protein